MNTKLLPKLYVVGGSVGYASYLLPREGREVQVVLTDRPEQADMAMFTGGSDISPSLYNAPYGSHTYDSPSRDKHEVEMFNFFRSEEVPMIGICRGMQLFNALLGGSMIQDVTGHAGGQHTVVFDNYQDSKGESLVLPFSSLHHQMVDPRKVKKGWDIIGRSEERRSRHYLDGLDEDQDGIDTEIELIYFPEINSLGIQGHPEFMDANCESVKFWRSLIRERLL